MIQLFSFARINSEIVTKGIPCIFITVELSRIRGPVSPAGKISIYKFEIPGQLLIYKGMRNSPHLRRSPESVDDK